MPPLIPFSKVGSLCLMLMLVVACSSRKEKPAEPPPFPMSAIQPAGKVIENALVKSSILGKGVRYNIYLPADYAGSQRSYPVVYLLHGYTDDNTTWVQSGEVNRYADKAIAEGTIPPVIIVMPNADSTWYVNSYDGQARYEDFFVQEFIPSIEKTYRIRSKKRYRGIAGLSMGGYGSLLYSLHHPDLFTAAAALSAAVFDDTTVTSFGDDWYQQALGPALGRELKGKARLTENWYHNSVLRLVETMPVTELKKVRYYIDCGDHDKLTKGNSLLHLELFNKDIPHDYRVRNGEHSWSYWRTGITDALQFIGQDFRDGGF